MVANFQVFVSGQARYCPRTPGILDYFGPEELAFFDLGDANDLAAKIEYVFRHPQETIEIVKRGQEVYRNHKWSGERLRFVSLVDRLLNRGQRGGTPLL